MVSIDYISEIIEIRFTTRDVGLVKDPNILIKLIYYLILPTRWLYCTYFRMLYMFDVPSYQNHEKHYNEIYCPIGDEDPKWMNTERLNDLEINQDLRLVPKLTEAAHSKKSMLHFQLKFSVQQWLQLVTSFFQVTIIISAETGVILKTILISRYQLKNRISAIEIHLCKNFKKFKGILSKQNNKTSFIAPTQL